MGFVTWIVFYFINWVYDSFLLSASQTRLTAYVPPYFVEWAYVHCSRFLSTRIEPSKPFGLVWQQIYTAHQHSCKPMSFIVQVQPKSVNKHQAKPLDWLRRTCLSNSNAKRTPTFFRTHPVRMKCLLGVVDKGFIDKNTLISLS